MIILQTSPISQLIDTATLHGSMNMLQLHIYMKYYITMTYLDLEAVTLINETMSKDKKILETRTTCMRL